MTGEPRPILVEGCELVLPEEADRPQRDVEGARGVSLGEHEHVVLPQRGRVKIEHGIKCGEIAADVADPGLVMHAQKATPRGACTGLESDVVEGSVHS